MMQTAKILEVIFKAIDEVNLALPEEHKLERSAQTVLFGKSGKLDSLGLVNLVLAVETRLEEDLGAEVTLADERSLLQKNSPLKTVGTLAEYIARLLTDDRFAKTDSRWS